MWIKVLKHIEKKKWIKPIRVGFTNIYSEFGIIETKRDLSVELEIDTMFWIYQFKKEFHETTLGRNFNASKAKKFINKFINTEETFLNKRFVYYSTLQTLYQRFFGYQYEKKLNQINLVVFDLKKKQLYSSFLKNSRIVRLLTNGMLLSKLKIFLKNKKKKLSTYNWNIKQIFSELGKKNFVIEIIGCKNHVFKIIRFIKKYNKLNQVFIFTPRRSFFQEQYKKIRSIKRKSSKRYNKYLKIY